MSSHDSCVTEHDKYAKGATKPGGAAANGFFGDGAAAAAPAAAAAAAASVARSGSEAVEGAEHLSTRFPWRCHLCGVTCTSQETLSGHASGLKHRRRARAAAKSKNQEGGGGGGGGEEEEEQGGKKGAAVAAAAEEAATTTASPSTPPQKGAVSEAPSKEEGEKKKENRRDKKKRKQEGGDGDNKGGGSNSSKKLKEEGKQPKWKKLALSVLSSTAESKSKKGMKVSKLLDAVLEAAGMGGAGKSDEKRREEALAAWRASGKLRVEGGRVALA